MSRAGRAVPLDIDPINVPEIPSTVEINAKKYSFLKDIEPGNELKLSIRVTVKRVNKDEVEYRICGDIEDLIEQPKPQPEGNSDAPIRS